MILVLDNYDSFTWNLVQHLGRLGAEPRVVRNDEATVEEILALAPDRIVISPGPGNPRDAGVSLDLIRAAGPGRPVLGVCLGHQAIAEAFGGRTIRSGVVMHGKTGEVRHLGEGLFRGLPNPLTVTRYHSLVTDPEALPAELEPVAWTANGGEEGEGPGEGVGIQAVRHLERPVWGVQFHPESHFSEGGLDLMRNFLEGC